MAKIEIEKAGTNQDQAPRAWICGVENDAASAIQIGDIFHIAGQPEDVKWRVVAIESGRKTR